MLFRSGAYHISENTVGSTYRYLAYYTDNTTKWDWRGYLNTNNGDPEIQFVAEGTYAQTVANAITTGVTCNAQGTTAPSVSEWNAASTAFSALTIAHEKVLLTGGTASESGDAIEQALAKYDYIVGKYGSATYADFLGRNPAPINGSKITIFGNSDISSNNTILIIAIVSVLSIAGIGGYFFLRRKKEQ